jgi:hypothetical protein
MRRPQSRPVRYVYIAAAMAIVALAAMALITPDWYPSLSTYGVSAGTNSHYCSADIVHWHLMLSCERSQ